MITENNMTLLPPSSRIGSPAGILCATPDCTLSGNGQVPVFQQLLALITGSGQDASSVQEGEMAETKDENAGVPPELVDEMALRFLFGVEAMPKSIPMILPEQPEDRSVQSNVEASLQIEMALSAGPVYQEAQVVLGEDGIQSAKIAPVNLQDPERAQIPISKASENENSSESKPVVIEGSLESSSALTSESKPAVMERPLQSSPPIIEGPLQSSPPIIESPLQSSPTRIPISRSSVPESLRDSSPEKTLESNAFVMKDVQESDPAIAKGSREVSSVITEGDQESNPAVMALSGEGRETIPERSMENGMEKTEEWTGEVVSSQEAKGFEQAEALEKPELCTQIKEEILDKLEQKGPSEFKLRLEPEELGEIDIKLKLSNGKLIIHIASANPKTQTLLASQVDKLLLSMGLPNAQVEILQGTFQSSTQGQDGSNSQHQSYPGHADMDFSQRQQREPLQRQWQNEHNRIIAGNILQQDPGRLGSDFLPGRNSNSNRMDYII